MKRSAPQANGHGVAQRSDARPATRRAQIIGRIRAQNCGDISEPNAAAFCAGRAPLPRPLSRAAAGLARTARVLTWSEITRSWPGARFARPDALMYKNLFSVAALTLLSRATGFIRDVMLGAVLGAGLLADAFVVAFRLPNHFRAIFGEGAFNAAYVPCYSQILAKEGGEASRRFASQIFTLLLASQIVLLALALAFTPQLIDLLAPGFRANPEKFATAVTLTRITFPYLLFITLVTLQSGTLNAQGRFTAAAFAPVLLNRRDDPFPRCRLSVSERRGGRGDRRYGLGRLPIHSHLLGAMAHRHSRAAGAAGFQQGGATFLCRPRASRHRFGGRAARALRRHDHRLDAADRRRLVDLLCRPHLSIADRGHRHRRRHRAPAGDEPQARRRAIMAAPTTRKTAPWLCRSRSPRLVSSPSS